MKKIIAMLLLIFSVTYSSSIYASAAEKWDYEVKPDTNQKLKVTGHKVDQYGDAVNDKKYTTTIDPKTTANKQKMGGVGIAKLLKKANWASVGVEAFQALLEGIDWVIDPESQSIWRYKNVDQSCTYCLQNWEYTVTGKPDIYNDPNEAIEAFISTNAQFWSQFRPYFKWIYIQFPPNHDLYKKKMILVIVKDGTTSSAHGKADLKDNKPDPKLEKEFLTPDQAADYANHTHPDYTNPKYAERANPLYKPEIQENLWKPHNKWEEENSPTVQEAIRQLEQANPDAKDDTIKENEPNPETGDKSFSLPAFCNWATAVCDFFDWMKQEPEKDPEQNQPDVDDKGIFSKTFDHVFLSQNNVLQTSHGNLNLNISAVILLSV